MKACMAGERTMTPLLACLSRLSRYLQGVGVDQVSIQSFLPPSHWSQEESLLRSWDGEERLKEGNTAIYLTL